MLKDTKLSSELKLEILAKITEGLSGSDLREMCRAAAMVPVRQYVRAAGGNQDILDKSRLEVSLLKYPSSLLLF